MSGTRELTLGDQFHRLKRTSLLLSSGLILSFIPGFHLGGADNLVSLAGISFSGVGLPILQALIFLALTYYFLGFVLEFIQEKRAQAEDLTAPGLTRLNEVAGDYAQAVKQYLETFRSVSQHTADPATVNKLADRFADYWTREELEALVAGATHRTLLELGTAEFGRNDPKIEELVFGRIAQALTADPGHLRAQLSNLSTDLRVHSNALQNLEAGVAGAVLEMQRVLRQLRGLRVDALTIRWVHFFGWELLGAAVPFAMAAYLVFSQLSFSEIAQGLIRMFDPR